MTSMEDFKELMQFIVCFFIGAVFLVSTILIGYLVVTWLAQVYIPWVEGLF
jgi:hypothetical protein